MLYRMSEHGASSKVFHQRCDDKPPYAVIVHANEHYIFGYYMPLPFVSRDRYMACDNCWIFSLQRGPKRVNPVRFQVLPSKKFKAIFQSWKSPCLGSSETGQADLYIK